MITTSKLDTPSVSKCLSSLVHTKKSKVLNTRFFFLNEVAKLPSYLSSLLNDVNNGTMLEKKY